jgi:DNA-binding response OmpR family regulator
MKRILAVDDEPHILKLIAFSLRSHGFEVLEAADGLSAVEIAQAEKPDLILLDVMMPALDGYEACRRIKADEETAEIPIFMLTAKTQATEETTGMDAGATDYIRKPFTPKDLVARVEEFFAETTEN